MNILSLCLVGGKLTTEYFNPATECELFNRLEEWGHNLKYTPSTEPYYVVIHLNHGNFWRRDTSPEGQSLINRLIVDIQSKHATLVIFGLDSYGMNKENGLSWVKHSAEFFNIPVGDIIYADAGYHIEIGMKRHGIKAIWVDWFQNLMKPDTDITDTARQLIIDRRPRSKKFVYFGGISWHRSHRLEFLTKAIKRCNFNEIAYYSNAPGSYYDYETNSKIHVPAKVLDLPELNHPKRRIVNRVAAAITPEFHNDSYVNVIANSYFSYDPGRLELNEKMYKPMYCLQPFINVGEVGTLKALRELGYQTFGQWFNESYDSLMDDEQRMEAVVSEVNRIGQMSDSALNDMLVDMLPVLEHNCALVTERYYSDQGFHDFVAKLESHRNLIISG